MSRSVSTRRLLFLAAFVVVVGVVTVHPTLARSIGADVWNVPALKQQLRETEAQASQLSAEDESIRRRLAVKETIVTDLIAGRATLADATDRFTELNASRPQYMAAIRESYPGTSDREKMARNVISYTLPNADPDGRDVLANRLEAELRQMLTGSAVR